jgi:hypothetical protein
MSTEVCQKSSQPKVLGKNAADVTLKNLESLLYSLTILVILVSLYHGRRICTQIQARRLEDCAFKITSIEKLSYKNVIVNLPLSYYKSRFTVYNTEVSNSTSYFLLTRNV